MLERLQREAAKLNGEIVSMSNSSDPYPIMENETGLTRKCLKILSKHNCRIQIITKSTTVLRDADLLSKVPSTVAMTITTENNSIAGIIEPGAPLPSERLKAVEALIKKGVSVSVRIDPIIPFVNDDPAPLIACLARIGVKHVTSSTYKVKRDNWQRLLSSMPKIAEKLRPQYFERGEKAGTYKLLPLSQRHELMKNVRTAALENGLEFGVCREGLSHLNTAPCDGSWLMSKS